MTQREQEAMLRQLNVEYTEKSNAIARQKEDVNARKQDALLEADDAFHAEKRKRLAQISKIRVEKAALFDGDPKRAMLEAEARNLEAEISVMRDDNESRKRTICHAAYADRRALDEQSRQLTEWIERRKLEIMSNHVDGNRG